MVLEIIVIGSVPKDCPRVSRSFRRNLANSMERTIREKLGLRSEDTVRIIFKEEY